MNRPSPSFPSWLTLMGLLWLGWADPPAAHGAQPPNPGQDPSPLLAASTNEITLSALEQNLTSISNLVAGVEVNRTNLIRVYLEARDRLLAADNLARQAEEWHRRLQSDLDRLPDLETRMARPLSNAVPRLATNAPLNQLNQAVDQIAAELDQTRITQRELDAEPMRRADRLLILSQLLASAQTALQEVERQLLDLGDGSEWLRSAQRIRLLAEQRYRVEEIRSYEAEEAYYAQTSTLPGLEEGLVTRRIDSLQGEQQILKTALQHQRRVQSAQDAARALAARRRAELLDELLVRDLATTNQTLAHRRVALAQDLSSRARQLDEDSRTLALLRAKFDDLESRVRAASRSGLNRSYAVGLALRRQEYILPDSRSYLRSMTTLQSEMSEAQLLLLLLIDERREVVDIESALGTVTASFPKDWPDSRREPIREECRRLLTEKRELLDSLVEDYRHYVEQLQQLYNTHKELANLVRQLKDYIEQRVLWIRSAHRLSPSVAAQEARAIWQFLTNPANAEVGRFLARDLLGNWVTYGLFLGLWTLLLAWHRPLGRRIHQAGQEASRAWNDSPAPALQALGFTFLRALPIPLLFAFLGWRLNNPWLELPFGDRVSVACLQVAFNLMLIFFLIGLCQPGGVAEKHFQWPACNTRLIRVPLKCLVPLLVPMGFLAFVLEGVFVEGLTNRLVFLPNILIGGFVYHLWFRPEKGLRLGHSADPASRWPLLARRLIYAVIMAMVVALAVICIDGYAFTARKIWRDFTDTFLVVLILVTLRSLVLHWVILVRRRLALQQARRRSQQAAESAADAGVAYEGIPPDQLIKESDLKSDYEQARAMVNIGFRLAMIAGLIWVWADFVPAFKAMDRVPLWRVEAKVKPIPQAEGSPLSIMGPAPTPSSTAPDLTAATPGDPAAAPARIPATEWRWITLRDLSLALLVVVITLVVCRYLPGFLQMVVFSRLHMMPGEGYALTTVTRYLLILGAIIASTQLLGLSWNKVHWLAAAVTVGIGFGLQEIFGNFVSGLIILFERPVRLGDVVTVGDVSGVVTRIRIRATTLREWDNKELILPNKEFITNRFINWSLTDSVVRLTCAVGVSYDADVRKTHELLLKIARAHPRVLKTPPPSALFRQFGDSTLNFELRAYVDDPDIRLQVMHDLNMAIIETFRQEGIEIAFPQRDLHIRSLPKDFPAQPPSPGPAEPGRKP